MGPCQYSSVTLSLLVMRNLTALLWQRLATWDHMRGSTRQRRNLAKLLPPEERRGCPPSLMYNGPLAAYHSVLQSRTPAALAWRRQFSSSYYHVAQEPCCLNHFFASRCQISPYWLPCLQILALYSPSKQKLSAAQNPTIIVITNTRTDFIFQGSPTQGLHLHIKSRKLTFGGVWPICHTETLHPTKGKSDSCLFC
jgi:hypothetical protein